MVELVIYDLMGREVAKIINEIQNPGYKSIVWKGVNNSNNKVSTGIYFYQLRTHDFVKTRKMVLLK
jgi:flagellar hook assembly protein FlgD